MKKIHYFILGLAFTFITWRIIDLYVKEMTFTEYFLIEIILVLSLRFYTFTIHLATPDNSLNNKNHSVDQEDTHP